MSIRRAATTIGAISLGLVALTACDKPTPLATVTVGTRSVTAEAVDKCYAHGKKLPTTIFRACLEAAPKHHITCPKCQHEMDVDMVTGALITEDGGSGQSGPG